MEISFRLLSICPRISTLDDRLFASTAWRLRLLTLGLFLRKVVVDLQQQELTIESRYFWLFRFERHIRFQDVEAVTYGYQDWAMGSALDWAHNSLDLFSVGLRLFNGDEPSLFHFFGNGTFVRDDLWPEWVYWKHNLLDLTGTQDPESKVFVELLSQIIGVTVVPSRY